MAAGMEYEIEPKARPSFPQEDILAALREIVSSKPFRTSKQCQRFLQYVVVNTLNGKEEDLKERVIGAAVLERNSDYNTADDPAVRIRAADVRKRLAMYYQEEGWQAKIRITIPSGSYRACFEKWDDSGESSHALGPALTGVVPSSERVAANLAEPAAVEAPLSLQVAPEAPPWGPEELLGEPEQPLASTRGKFPWKRPAVVVLAAMLLAGVCLAVWQLHQAGHQQSDLFWAPVVGGSRPPIIYVGNNAVYRLKVSFLLRYQQSHPEFKPDAGGLEKALPAGSEETLSFRDLDADDSNFVGIGDVASAVAVSSFFQARHVHYDLRLGRDIVGGDFRTTPVVLIGAFNNHWTLKLNAGLPYRFTVKNLHNGIEGHGHFWQTGYGDDGEPREDYALITRQIDTTTGEPVVAIAGADQTGTQAAAQFATNPAYLDAALRKLPHGWQNKKLQLVLHTTVLDRIPGAYEVIAYSVQ